MAWGGLQQHLALVLTKIWAQTISRQVSSRVADGRLWPLTSPGLWNHGCGDGRYIELHIRSSHQHD